MRFRVPRTALSATVEATAPLREPALDRAENAVRGLRGSGAVLVIYVAGRVLSTGFFALVYFLAPVLNLPYASHHSTKPTFLQLFSAWDGKYYRQIALIGYPTQLPLDATGHVAANAWAFLPLYPWLTRGLMMATGLSFTAAGITVSVLFGAVAAVLLYRLLAGRIGNRPALWVSACFSLGPMSFLFQVTYADTLFLALLFACLLLMAMKHYLLMIPLGVAAAFTHPGELALAAALAILFISGLIRREAVSRVERIRMIVAGLTLAAAGFAWPLIADSVTGNKSAYFDTELSWWTGWVGRIEHFVPFTPWFDLFYRYLGAAGVVAVIALVAGFVFWLTRPGMRALGDEILAFSGSYGAYLVAVFLPQQSIARLLLPLSPLFGMPALSMRPRLRRVTLAVLVALGPFAIAELWFIFPP
ncbi:MAG TPA: hypothetical protein VGI56_03735 [Galbitalea sp.]